MKTAIYARQSIDRPDSVSIESQIQQCEKIAQGETQNYPDAGYSGKNIKRPHFEQMLQDIKAGLIDTVMSYRLDRISRNIIDFANLLNFFEKYNVKYISATEQFDTSTPMGRAMIYIVMVFAQLERETIATRILDNYRFRANRGLYMGGNTPFGYDSKRITMDGKKASILVPNDEAKTLQRIFNMFTSMDSLVGICHALNQEGIRTSRGNLWVSNALKRVLRNISPCCADENLYEFLIASGYNVTNSVEQFDGEHGMCLFFKNKNRNQMTDIGEQVAVVGLHKPIITSEQYIKAQQILNSNAPQRGKRSHRTFLTGIIKCKKCGYSFGIKYTQKNDKKYSYYRCRGRESRGVCNNDIYIPSEQIENGVIEQCRQHIKNYDFKKVQSTVDNQPLKISVEIEQLKLQIENLVDNIGKGNAIVDNLLTKKITSLQEQIDMLTSKTNAPRPAVAVDSKTVEWLKLQINHFASLDILQKTDVIRSIVKTIWVDCDGKIAIEYLF